MKLSDIPGLLPDKKKHNVVSSELMMFNPFSGKLEDNVFGFNKAIDLMNKTIYRDRLVEIILRFAFCDRKDINSAKKELADQIISKMGEWITNNKGE